MTLTEYFTDLIRRVETSDIQNNGTDKNGFYKPTRTLLLRHLTLLRDLHGKPRAKDMVRSSWAFVCEELPPEWLAVDEELQAEMKRVLD